MKWAVTYEGAHRDDGTLFFPERLSEQFLADMRRTQGTYKYFNQYENKVLPDGEMDFKQIWIKNYTILPTNCYTFAFIDPAISLNDGADYTASVVVDVDADKNWYVKLALRQRITATDTVKWIFKLYEQFKPAIIGIEDVAYQKALLHFTVEEMHRRNTIIPIKGIRRSNISSDGSKFANNSKPFRIRSLIPRFEFGKIFVSQGLDDFLMEYKSFPRGSHDDILDALASIEEIAFYPNKEKEVKRELQPNDTGYESEFIKKLKKQTNSRGKGDEYGDY
jgi:predicted phage terminase large subunit-like protein